jgi:hypothetical protein
MSSRLSKRKANNQEIIDLTDPVIEEIDLTQESPQEQYERFKKEQQARSEKLKRERNEKLKNMAYYYMPKKDAVRDRILAEISKDDFATMAYSDTINEDGFRNNEEYDPEVMEQMGMCLPTGFCAAMGIKDSKKRKQLIKELHELPQNYQTEIIGDIARAHDRHFLNVYGKDRKAFVGNKPNQEFIDFMVRLGKIPLDDPYLYQIALVTHDGKEGHLVTYDPREKMIYDPNIKGPLKYTNYAAILQNRYKSGKIAWGLEKKPSMTWMDPPPRIPNPNYAGYGLKKRC